MTQIALFLYMISTYALALRWPLIAAFTFMMLSVGRPEAGNVGILALPWSILTLAVFALIYIGKGMPDFSLRSRIFVYILIFFAWTTFTNLFAVLPGLAWDKWWIFTKTLIPIFLIGGAISDKRMLNLGLLSILAGVSSIILSGLLQVVVSAGSSQVVGVPGTEFAQNNEVARLMGVVGLPYALFLSFHANGKLVRTLSWLLFIASVIAIVGTTSRGALLALAGTFLVWGLMSKRRLTFLLQGTLLFGLLAAALSTNAADRYLNRFETIQDYEVDRSAQGRIYAWNFGMRIAQENPITGGGFNVFRISGRPNDPNRGWIDAHSHYFEVLGEHGYVGLFLYLLIQVSTFRTASRVKRRCKDLPQHYWERDLATATQISLVFFAIGGLTGSTTYVQYSFFTIMIVAILDKITPRPGTQVTV